MKMVGFHPELVIFMKMQISTQILVITKILEISHILSFCVKTSEFHKNPASGCSDQLKSDRDRRGFNARGAYLGGPGILRIPPGNG